MIKDKLIQAQEAARESVKLDPNRLAYHIMPPAGWLNDPNGLMQLEGIYHIYYQYSPDNPNGGKKAWGHYTTRDFVNYKEEDIALFPDSEIDRDGAYSGSAFVKDGKAHFYYTGNIKFEGDHDYIHTGRGHYTNTFESKDGINLTEKRTLLKNEDYPEDVTCHVRDPKVFEEDGRYYMVLGARTNEDVGQVLVYESDDLENWKYARRIESDKPFGYMWECPDLFELDDEKVLITCPQGVDQKGHAYENIYQNGYFLTVGKMDGDLKLSEFHELDNGFDFYAPQTFEDEKGRRILIGWMGMPDAEYANPTVEAGWQHALTLPRELHLDNERLYQYPIEEIENLQTSKEKFDLEAGQAADLKSRVFHLRLFPETDAFEIRLRNEAVLSLKDGLFTLKLEKGGYGRDARHLEIVRINQLDIFSDTSSLEIFINKGEYAFTTRIYDDSNDTQIVSDADMKGTLWQMGSFTIEEKIQG